MKTIAQQLNIKKFPFKIRDENGNRIYGEDSDGYWSKQEFDSDGNRIYFENSYGFWQKQEYNSNGYEIYYEDADGIIEDKRPKIELTLEDIAKLEGVSVEQIKIKK